MAAASAGLEGTGRVRVSANRMPGAEQAAEQDELAEVIRIMVGCQQRFAEDGLSRAVRDARGEIRFRAGYELLQGAAIAQECADAAVPRGGARRGGGFRPVAAGKIRRDVFRVAAELKDVPLRDARVLEQFPGGMRRTLRADAAQACREIRERFRPVEMRVMPAEEFRQLPAKRFLVHGEPLSTQAWCLHEQTAKVELRQEV